MAANPLRSVGGGPVLRRGNCLRFEDDTARLLEESPMKLIIASVAGAC